jgi:hypothetical protein
VIQALDENGERTPDVVYVRFVDMAGMGDYSYVADGEALLDAQVLSMVWRPECDSWLLHSIGDYLRPEELPRTSPGIGPILEAAGAQAESLFLPKLAPPRWNRWRLSWRSSSDVVVAEPTGGVTLRCDRVQRPAEELRDGSPITRASGEGKHFHPVDTAAAGCRCQARWSHR